MLTLAMLTTKHPTKRLQAKTQQFTDLPGMFKLKYEMQVVPKSQQFTDLPGMFKLKYEMQVVPKSHTLVYPGA